MQAVSIKGGKSQRPRCQAVAKLRLQIGWTEDVAWRNGLPARALRADPCGGLPVQG